MPITLVGNTAEPRCSYSFTYSLSGGIGARPPPVLAEVFPRRLVAEDHRVGAGAVQQPERHAGVAGVIDAALPFHHHDVGVLGALEHQPLRGAGDEVRDDRVDRDAPALDEDAGLSRRHEPGLAPSRR